MPPLERQIKDKTLRIAVVGLGYVGLPLLLAFADAGFNTFGIDESEKRLADLSKGGGLTEYINSGRVKLQSGYDAVKECGAVFLCVPTPLDERLVPDMSYIDSAVLSLLPCLHDDMLIVLESTTYPGTLKERIAPLIEKAGFSVGEKVCLASSPERIDPGNKSWNVKNTPKIVGGINDKSTSLAAALYESAIEAEVIKVSSPETAETEKLLENIYRNVNIALINELSQLCELMGVSVWEVIDAARTKPYGFSPFYPGLGPGGHCIPLDPWYLAHKAREFGFHTTLIEAASRINLDMPRRVMMRAARNLSQRGICISKAKILLLGAAYKADVADLRESPALKLLALLKKEGAEVTVWEPLAEGFKKELTDTEIAAFDLVIVGAAHSCFDLKRIENAAKAVLDTKNAFKNIKDRRKIDLL